MVIFSKELLEQEIENMKSQLIWVIKNFYKDPLSDFALVWLDRFLVLKEEIERMKELSRSSPSENEDMK